MDAETGCWRWTGMLNDYGYGRYSHGLTHRITYTQMVGSIPDGMELDHLCRNRDCCNPRHVEVVTAQENTRRGQGPAGLNARKTHCPQGHPYSGDNLQVKPTGARRCRECARVAAARAYHHNMEKRRASARESARRRRAREANRGEAAE